jgi:hypothetical protein
MDVNHPAACPALVPFSNNIHQIHMHPDASSVSILEVCVLKRLSCLLPLNAAKLDHLDAQIQLFDDRKKHGFNRPADCEFGHRSVDGRASRYSRGSTHLSYFVRGYPDGCVCIWDYRNAQVGFKVSLPTHMTIDYRQAPSDEDTG